MDRYLNKHKMALKFVAAFSLLLSSFLFASTAHAAAREVDNTLRVAPMQVAYYGGYYHRHWRGHRWHRGHHWHRGGWHHGWHRHHWRR